MGDMVTYECPYCVKWFPTFYKNKGTGRMVGYYGNGQKYNFRGATSNFIRHVNACRKRADGGKEK